MAALSRARRRSLLLGGDDVADLRVDAVRWVEVGTAIDEVFEFCFQSGELALSRPNGVHFGRQQGADVGARGVAVAAQVEDAGDFDEGQPCCLCAANEPEPGEARGLVVAVAVGLPGWRGQQALTFVETNRLGQTRRPRRRRL